MRVDLVLLAKGIAFHIAVDEGGEPRPPELGGDQLACFQKAWVAGRRVIVAARENGAAQGVVGRDIDTAFVGKDASFDLPVCEPGTEGERNVLMHGLEGLENKGVTHGSGFDAMRESGVD